MYASFKHFLAFYNKLSLSYLSQFCLIKENEFRIDKNIKIMSKEEDTMYKKSRP
jgi:hypothetical protein